MTLLIVAATVVLLVIIARLVSVEFHVSRGYSYLLRADLAAQAGQADASNLLLNLFKNYPDSVTYFDPHVGSTSPGEDKAGTPGTVFMYMNTPINQQYVGSNAGGTNNYQIYCRPLISGATTQTVNQYSQTLTSTQIARTSSVDINAASAFGTDPNGWVGLPDPNGVIASPFPYECLGSM